MLYKYINDEIINPLGLNINNCYCTNLLKCETSEAPEDIKLKKKDFLNNALKNCKNLFETEISIINPKIIIGLSGKVLEFISENFYNKKLSMREDFGKLFKIKIAGKDYSYIPVLHLTSPQKVKVRNHYFNSPDNQSARLTKLSKK